MAVGITNPAVTNVSFTYDAGTFTLRIMWEGTALSYNVYGGLSADPMPAVPTNVPTLYLDKTVEPGRRYNFRVDAIYTGGIASTPVYAGVTIPSGADAPYNFRVVGKTCTTEHLAWDGPLGRYVITWIDDLGNTYYDIVENVYEYRVLDLDETRTYKFYLALYVGDEQIPVAKGVYIDGCGEDISTVPPSTAPATTTSGTTTSPATTTSAPPV